MAEEFRRVPVGRPTRKRRDLAREPAPAEAGPPADCDCPRPDPADWDGVESDWGDITFLKSGTTAVLGVPVGYDSARSALAARAAELGATVPEDAMLLLGAGRFRRSLMLEVEDLPAGAKGVERPGGIAWSRLLAAPWGEMQKAVDGVKAEAKTRYGREPDNLWVWYLTCRLCSGDRNFETMIIAHYRHAP